MALRDLKYILAYLTPLTCWVSLNARGVLSFGTIFFVFLLVPVFEQILRQDTSNFNKDTEKVKTESFYFDLLLYLNLPILYFLLFVYFEGILAGQWTGVEILGKTLSIGIIVGSIGINVAHEIGHRAERHNQVISQLLLLPALYMHFNIEHNRGHHKWVATPKDPATSRYGESFYRFWFRTVIGSYLSAWHISNQDQIIKSAPIGSLSNKMVRFTIVELLFLCLIAWIYNWQVMVMAVAIAIIGFTLLELVNYIEHYGLQRKLLDSGRYEPVASRHSWNSDHELGRILLYELTRHSDHHYKSTRKYQVLRHFDQSPQLPWGYPGSIIMALIPPLWYRVIHPELKKLEST